MSGAVPPLLAPTWRVCGQHYLYPRAI